jgi:DNA-binding transcriptional MocR family regulator
MKAPMADVNTRLDDLGHVDPRLYVRVAEMLRRQIEDGALSAGSPAPSITTLVREHGHSRRTCGTAMRLLEREGLLVRIAGLGYYVTSHMPAADRAPAQTAPGQWQAATYRCSCGHATGKAGEFGQHLNARDGAEPEHFEVLDGWTIEEVKRWQAATAGPPAARA